MIKRFDEHNENTALKKVWYIDLHDLRESANDDVERFQDDNNHDNGHAFSWFVNDPKDSAYPGFDEYFINNGLNIGERVIIHSTW